MDEPVTPPQFLNNLIRYIYCKNIKFHTNQEISDRIIFIFDYKYYNMIIL